MDEDHSIPEQKELTLTIRYPGYVNGISILDMIKSKLRESINWPEMEITDINFKEVG